MHALLHQIHIDYAISDFTSNHNLFGYLFPLLEGVDPLERRWYFPNRVRSRFLYTEEVLMETRLEQELDAFKAELAGLVDRGLRECSVVFMYVNETLNALRRLGCPLAAHTRETNLRNSLELVRELGTETLCVTRRMSLTARLEEVLANNFANTELYRGRYERFCTDIAGRLIAEKVIG